MTPLEVLKQVEGMKLEDENGTVTELRLLPPLAQTELQKLESNLPCPLPEEARELFSYCRGLEGAFTGVFTDIVQEVEFAGLEGGFGLEEVCPHAISIAGDGTGNYWVVDLTSASTSWGPIFYACHDAPVVVFQTDSLAHFISELLRLGNPPWESELADVHGEYEGRIWLENPGVMTQEQCLGSRDGELKTFAESLDETWLFVDLREPRLGDGFSWGRFGGIPEGLRRFGEKRIFAYRQRKSLWQRLLGR